jgi:uncharacterized C2H2 Zn-finger protein
MTTFKCDLCGRHFADEKERDAHVGKEHGTNLGQFGGGA